MTKRKMDWDKLFKKITESGEKQYTERKGQSYTIKGDVRKEKTTKKHRVSDNALLLENMKLYHEEYKKVRPDDALLLKYRNILLIEYYKVCWHSTKHRSFCRYDLAILEDMVGWTVESSLCTGKDVNSKWYGWPRFLRYDVTRSNVFAFWKTAIYRHFMSYLNDIFYKQKNIKKEVLNRVIDQHASDTDYELRGRAFTMNFAEVIEDEQS